MNPLSDSTTQYYDANCEEYARSTLNLDMSSLYEPFLAMIPKGGRILDAGCGAGRDSMAFLDRGYDVTAFDASKGMADLASRLIDRPVTVMRFQEMTFDQAFDGVWACASLLHVPRPELTGVLERLAKAVVPGGICYASFKYGAGERTEAGRMFTDMNEDEIGRMSSQCTGLAVVRVWITPDVRPGRCGERRINVLLRRISSKNIHGVVKVAEFDGDDVGYPMATLTEIRKTGVRL